MTALLAEKVTSRLANVAAWMRPAPQELATRYILNNLAVTRAETWAYFVLADVDWHSKSDTDRGSLYLQQAARVAELAGSPVWLRGVRMPYPAAAYRAALEQEYPDAGPMFADVSDRAAAYPVAVGASSGAVVLGVRVAARPIPKGMLRHVLAEEMTIHQIEDVRVRYRRVAASVAGGGWEASPISEDGLDWVYAAGRALGHDVPAGGGLTRSRDWAAPDVTVTATQDDAAPTVRVAATVNGRTTTRHTHVMRAEVQQRDVEAQAKPWLAWAADQETHVEWVARLDVIPGKELNGAAIVKARRNRDVGDHLAEHNTHISDAYVEGIARAADVASETGSADPVVATRVRGQVLFAVSADTEQDTLDAADIIRAAADAAAVNGGPGIRFASAPAQWADYRKFIPGEPWSGNSGHSTQMPARMVAAGVPNASMRAGDTIGVPLGVIRGSNELAVFDAFGGIRADRDRPGVWAVIGEQGSGKTTMLSLVAWWLTLAGIPGTLYDPTGAMTRILATVGDAGREFRLTAGNPGLLSPHFLIPEPARVDYDTDRDYAGAVAEAAGARMDTAYDAALLSLEPDTLAAYPEARAALREAITDVGGVYGTHPRDVITAIRKQGTVGAVLAKQIEARAMFADGQLMWPQHGTDDEIHATFARDAQLTLVTTPGAVKPPPSGTPLAQWSADQIRSRPIHMLGALFASRAIWANRDRKFYLSDEVSLQAGADSASSAWMMRIAHDSRKYGCSAGFAMQTSSTVDLIGQRAASLFAAAFVGRTKQDNAAGALGVLGVGDGEGWEDVPPTLQSGSFLSSSWDDKTRVVDVDKSWWPRGLVEATNTTPVRSAPRLASPLGVR